MDQGILADIRAREMNGKEAFDARMRIKGQASLSIRIQPQVLPQEYIVV